MTRTFRATLATLALATPLAGCPDDTDPATTCVTTIADTCTPLYTPTWDDVYTRTIQTKCAQGGTSCHGSAPGQGGLDMSDKDTAHDALVGSYVNAGDAACSEMVIRLASEVATQVMPPGAPLSASERCSVEKWIASGAAR